MRSELDHEQHEHLVHFYEGADDLASRVRSHLAHTLDRDGGVLIVATAAHTKLFLEAISEDGIDIDSAAAAGRLVTLDAAAMLASFMRDGRPDRDAFEESVGAQVRELVSRCGQLYAYGEMVAVLWSEGRVTAALELEALWNDLQREVPFDLFCSYPSHVIADAAISYGPAEICSLHGVVTGAAPVDEGAERCARFPRSLAAIGSARRLVVETLSEWDMTDTAPAAMSVVSELVTNALCHGRSDVSVGLSREVAGLRIAVGDAGAGRAAPAAREALSEGGRGLELVDALSLEWGQRRRPVGKIVWATVQAPPPRMLEEAAAPS